MSRSLTATPTLGPTNLNGHAPPMGSEDTETPQRRRIPPLAWLVVVAVAAFGAFVALTPLQPRALAVLVVRSPVAQGALISRSDLGVMSLAAPKGLAVLPASAEATVVGSHASVQLTPGELVATSDYSATPLSQAMVGLALRAGQFPNDLAAGMRVAVLQADPRTNAPMVLAGDANVVALAPSAGTPNGALVVLGVPTNVAGRVALAGQSASAVLVVLP
jgi:hypothetical protein